MNNRRSTTILLVAVVLSLCVFIVALGLWMWNSFGPQRTQATAPATSEGAPAETAAPDDRPSATAPGGNPPTEEAAGTGSPSAELSPEVAAMMDTIQQQVIDLRALNPAGSFSRTILSRDELEARVLDDFFADYSEEEAADDTRILAALGLLEPDFDLIGLFTDLYSEQILGFYDDTTQEMVVVGSSDFGGPEKITYAHEYAHALQDENFDFDEGLGYTDENCKLDTERCGAIQALVEGEATLVEFQWFFQYASPELQQEIIASYSDVDQSTFNSAPAYLQKDFAFPYDQGYTFVEYLYNRGGWDAINAVYADPPVSTEQIIHPEAYPADVPDPVDLPDLAPVLGDGWEMIDDNVLGEWYTYLVLGQGENAAARLDDGTAADAAAGWGGDRYEVWLERSTGRLVLAMKSVWDTPQDRGEYADAFKAYADGRFGPSSGSEDGALLWESDNGVDLFTDTGDATIWISAPDPALAQQVLEAVR